MFVVVCYDISDDRRRDRVMRLLQNYGQRVQYSVFECDLTSQHYAALRAQLLATLHEPTDSVRYYVLCRTCKNGVDVANSPPVASSPQFYVV